MSEDNERTVVCPQCEHETTLRLDELFGEDGYFKVVCWECGRHFVVEA